MQYVQANNSSVDISFDGRSGKLLRSVNNSMPKRLTQLVLWHDDTLIDQDGDQFALPDEEKSRTAALDKILELAEKADVDVIRKESHSTPSRGESRSDKPQATQDTIAGQSTINVEFIQEDTGINIAFLLEGGKLQRRTASKTKNLTKVYVQDEVIVTDQDGEAVALPAGETERRSILDKLLEMAETADIPISRLDSHSISGESREHSKIPVCDIAMTLYSEDVSVFGTACSCAFVLTCANIHKT